ncbi:MAG TPA: leucyl/phenylalanyl-tRNA--protein transferase [Steroidobacteraceae bacterium]|nr:leucyl/phenylalanyl-tRNA--protein transferase [Steroidobacteraceae bacterium]
MRSITWLSPQDAPDCFPPPEHALEDPPGLLAAGGDLSPARLLAAYRRGIFPWYSPGQPVLWWSPDPRAVLFPEEFRCARSLAKTLRNGGLSVAVNRDFASVIDSCAAPRAHGQGTWITREMRHAYLQLHRMEFAHSIETYRDDVLVGGLYGVRLGGIFFGESMFSRERDASKVALAHLVGLCRDTGIAVIDCQLASRHLQSLGSRAIARGQFLTLLREQISLKPQALS